MESGVLFFVAVAFELSYSVSATADDCLLHWNKWALIPEDSLDKGFTNGSLS